MTGGEDKAVTIGPDGIVRVKAEEVLLQAIGYGCERHRRTRMSRPGLLDRVHERVRIVLIANCTIFSSATCISFHVA